MKVLFVLPEFGDDVRGGIARFYGHAIAGLTQAGCNVEVCVAQVGIRERMENGVRIFGVSADRIEAARAALAHFEFVPGLRQQLALATAAYEACAGGAGHDVIEVTDWGMLFVPWLTLPDRTAPVLVQFHGSPGQIGYVDPFEGDELAAMLTRMLEVSLLPRADGLQTPGRSNARDWTRLLARDVDVLHPAFPVSPSTLWRAPRAYGAVASRLQSWKGPEVLCAACSLMGEQAPRILWIGDDHPYGELSAPMSARLAALYPGVWNKSVVHVGGRAPHVTSELQASAHFIVHPSTWDCFPLAVVEAMAAGKVVICSEEAGTSELIAHGRNGFRFSSEHPQDLADVLRQASTASLDDMHRMGEAARDTIASTLDPAKITQARLATYGALRLREDRASHPWLEACFGPRKTGDRLGFLDAVPARDLASRVVARARERLKGHPRLAQTTRKSDDELRGFVAGLPRVEA